MKEFDQFGMEACLESVAFDIEHLHKNPFQLLGEYIIRAKQDPFFNKTMIAACEKYIEDKGIRWNDKF